MVKRINSNQLVAVYSLLIQPVTLLQLLIRIRETIHVHFVVKGYPPTATFKIT